MNRDPLKSVPLHRPSNKAQKAELTGEELEKLSAAAQTKPPEETKEEKPEVDIPGIDPEELGYMLEMQSILQDTTIGAKQRLRQLEDRRKEIQRNEDLEERLKKESPIRLSDLLLKDYVAQEVTVVPDEYFFTFRTLSNHLDITIDAAVERIISQWSELKDTSYKVHLQRVATLACGLESLCGAAGPAARINSLSGEDQVKAIVEETNKLLKKSHQILEDLMTHQALFILRVRKIVSLAGYTEQEAGKS